MTPQIIQKQHYLVDLESQRRHTLSLTGRSILDREIRAIRRELDGLRRERLLELKERKLNPRKGN